ncbi:MAG: STAS domain-containing protein [Actinomycetota bacterium]|nr:STAS domain-containing protein [Actinomycetota bacterium]
MTAQSTNPSWIDEIDHHLQIVVADNQYPARLALAGDLDLAGGDQLESMIQPWILQGARVELETHLLGFVDSSGLAALIAIAQRLEEVGGHLVLVDPSAQLLHLLELTRTGDQFTISNAPARVPMHVRR